MDARRGRNQLILPSPGARVCKGLRAHVAAGACPARTATDTGLAAQWWARPIPHFWASRVPRQDNNQFIATCAGPYRPPRPLVGKVSEGCTAFWLSWRPGGPENMHHACSKQPHEKGGRCSAVDKGRRVGVARDTTKGKVNGRVATETTNA